VRFTLYINPQTRGPEDDALVIGAVTEQALDADASGFHAVLLTEHHFTNYNAFSDPFMFAAYLAPQIKHARLGFSVAVPPLHHPLRFAEHCNLLDQFTNGRAIIGVGVGGGPIEFAGFGRRTEDRRELTEEVLDIAIKAWAHQYGEPPLEFNSPAFAGRLDGRIIPTSVRKPHPLLARACVSDESVIRSAERGWPIFTGRFPPDRTGRQWALYRDTLAAAGHSAAIEQECRDWSAMLKIVYVAETDEQAEREIAEPLANYLRAARLANSADRIYEASEAPLAPHVAAAAASPVGPPSTNGPYPPSATTLDTEAFKERAMIFGSPHTVAREIQNYADVGVTGMMLWLTWGYNDADRVRSSLRLFVNEVMPRFAAAPPPRRG
jgi:alkanesulfonate monooxygenase SsuD/methylene tetrahydromethanopterin reductase-like flavin-dependent oxidoreductase (luciferase family)